MLEIIFLYFFNTLCFSYGMDQFQEKNYEECVECPDGYYSFNSYKYSTCLQCGCDGCLKNDIINKTTNEIIKHAGSCSK